MTLVVIDKAPAPKWIRKRKPFSEETKKILSEQKKGERHPKFKGYYVTPGGIFTNLINAAAANKIDRRTLAKRIRAGEWTCKGYFMSDHKNHELFVVTPHVPHICSKPKKHLIPQDRYRNGVSYERSLNVPKIEPEEQNLSKKESITFEEYMKMEEEGLI